MEMECKRTIYAIFEQEVGLRDEIFYDNLQCYISSRRRKEHNAVNAVIADFHVHEVNMSTWLFKNAG